MSHLRAPATRADRREGGRHGRPVARPAPALPETHIRPQLLRLAVLPPIAVALSGCAAVLFTVRSTGARPGLVLWGVLGGAVSVALAGILIAAVAAGRAAKSVSDRVGALRRASARREAELRSLVEGLRRGEVPPGRGPRSGPADDADDFELLATDLARAHDGAVSAVVQAAQLSSQAGSEQKLEVFVNLARRLQSLVHREISILDELENEIEDPDLLKGLFHVDHLATRIRRHAENLAVLGGAVSRRQWSNPVSMTEVLRSAIAEVEQYSRVKLVPPIDGTLRGHAVADVIHLLAELVENATVFSAPHTQVLLRANLVTSGLAVEVEDRGLGMPVAEQQRMNALLADPDQVNVASLLADGRIGLFVVSQLAKRHGIHVRLQTNIYGGVQAVLVVPQALLGSAPGAVGAQPPEATGAAGASGAGVSPAGPGQQRGGHEARHRAPAGSRSGDSRSGESRSGTDLGRRESSSRDSVRSVDSGRNGSRVQGTNGSGAVPQRSGGAATNGRGMVPAGNGSAPNGSGSLPGGTAVRGDAGRGPGGGASLPGGGRGVSGGPGSLPDGGSVAPGGGRAGGEPPTRGGVFADGGSRVPGDGGGLSGGGVPSNGGPGLPGREAAVPDGGGRLPGRESGTSPRASEGANADGSLSRDRSTGSGGARPTPLPVRGARAERPNPADAVPGIRADDRRLVAEHIVAPPTPRTGTVRGTMGKPQLPRRRAQEHIAPQLRGGPTPPRPDAEYLAGHDPGLMAAFQRGISLAEAQQHLEPVLGDPDTSPASTASAHMGFDHMDATDMGSGHMGSGHMDAGHTGSLHTGSGHTGSLHMGSLHTDTASTPLKSRPAPTPEPSASFDFDFGASHTDAAPTTGSAAIDVTPMERPHISEAHGGRDGVPVPGLDLDRTTPRHDGSAPAG